MTTPRTLLLSAVFVLLPVAAEARIVEDAPTFQPSPRHIQSEARQQQESRSLRGSSGTAYVNADEEVRLWYPKGWTKVDDDYEYLNARRIAFFLPPGETADTSDTAISVVIEEPAPKNTETYLVNAVWWLKDSFADFLPEEADVLKVAERTAYSLVFTATAEEGAIKVKEVFVLHGGKTYIFSLWSTPESYDDFIRAFDKTVATVKLGK